MFCSNCGKEIAEGTAFCTNCGTQQGTNEQAAPINTQQPVQQTQKTAKKSKKKIAAIVLFCLQAVAFLGTAANGELANLMSLFSGGVYGIFEVLGFFLPAIIGVILLIVDKKKPVK